MKTNIPLLNLNQVSLRIPAVDNAILRDINYCVSSGDFVVILGSNGSGKSSLLKLLNRRYQATAGNIYFSNTDITKINSKHFYHDIIMLTQNCDESLFISLTVLENYFLFKKRNRKNFIISNKKERMFLNNYLQEFNPYLSQKLDQRVESLSGGEKQALALALSVLYPPKILLLDEHTSALDPKSAQVLMRVTQQIIQKHQITCIMTTHNLDIAMQYGNRILALKQGEILQMIDKNDTKFDSSDLLAACY